MFVGVIALLVVGIVPVEGEGAPKVEWPEVRAGIWEIRSVRTLPNGKTQAWTEELSACSDTSYIFRGYWGLGIVEAGGCEYASDRLSKTELRIAAKCTVRGSGVARSTMVIAVKDENSFSLRVEVREGRRRYRGEEDARWIRSCPPR